MVRRTLAFASAAAFALLVAPAASFADDAPGKTLFLAQKCSLCHSIASQAIEHTTKSEKMVGPALDGVGSKHDAAWMALYVTKKEKLHDKAHPKEAKLSDEELKTLTDWLAALPAAP